MKMTDTILDPIFDSRTDLVWTYVQ